MFKLGISASSFYGAEIGEIASGNSNYAAGSEYVAASWGLRNDKYVANGYVVNPPEFRLDGRETVYGLTNVSDLAVGNLNFRLIDLSTSPPPSSQDTNTSSLPANSGWTTFTLKNASGTTVLSLARSAASYSAFGTPQSYDGGFRFVASWNWSGITNPFPNSDNTTLFTVELEI